MADFITQFPENEVVSRENFNSRIAEANTALTTVQDAAAVAQTTANTALSNTEALNTGKLDTGGNGSNLTAVFSQAGTRANIVSGEKLSVIFGKIMKWFADLGAAAWMGTGTTASTVALGNHTHTAAAVGAVPTTRKVNGKALSADVTLTASDVGARAEDWLPTPEQIFASRALQSDVTLYVSPSGSDSTGDGTSGKPYKTITKAINAIPKNMNGFNATIDVGAGTYNEQVAIISYSAGMFIVSLNGAVTINTLYIARAAVLLYGGYTLTSSRIAVVEGGNMHTSAGADVVINNGTDYYGANIGLVVDVYSVVALSGNTTINNTTGKAVVCSNNSQVYIYNLSGANNTGTGLRAANGGKIAYSSKNIAASTAAESLSGGRIYSSAQTSIPNY